MVELNNLTIKSYLSGIDKWFFSAKEVLDFYLKKIKSDDQKYNSFVRLHLDYIDSSFDLLKKKPLKALPIWLKDNILTKWYITSFGSNIWKNFISPYSASFFKKLEKEWWMMIWKTNMDEFAMWSSTETSAFWVSKNFYWENRIPWWSSWWSAVAVAWNMCIASFWTDTAWSVRQPASLCGVVWFKPSYWRVSRYWIQAMASSLDQVWTFTKNIWDCVYLFNIISWYDEKDETSYKWEFFVDPNSLEKNFDDIKKYKIAIPKQFFSLWLSDEINIEFQKILSNLRKKWFQIDEVDIPSLDYSLNVYYTIMPAEISTNLARFDGIRFWLQKDMFKFENISEYYKNIRTEWFWDEVKRRIFIWTYVLNSENYEEYYLKAKYLQKTLIDDMDKVFSQYDFVIWPTSPDVAWKIGEKIDDPVKMYLSDVYTVPANICWIPWISIPAWFISKWEEKLPWWLQVLSKKYNEKNMFYFSYFLENFLK